MLTDFFSYCGEVKKCTLYSEESTQVATLHFADATATQSALLLDGAVIYELPVSIFPLTPQIESQLAQKTAAGSSGGKQSKTSGDKTQSSIVASLLANGYSVGASAIAKARAYDSTYFFESFGCFVTKSSFLAQKLKGAISSTVSSTMKKVTDFQKGIENTANDMITGVKSYFGFSTPPKEVSNPPPKDGTNK